MSVLRVALSACVAEEPALWALLSEIGGVHQAMTVRAKTRSDTKVGLNEAIDGIVAFADYARTVYALNHG